MGANHARVFASLPDAELIGVVDSDTLTAARVAGACDCRSMDGIEGLIEAGVEAVSVAVPASMHADVAVEVIQRGIDLLVEKPLAEGLEQAQYIVESARSSGAVLMVGHVERFNPAVMKLKECVDQGLLGNIISMSARRVGPYSPRIRGAGIILDLATHDINVMGHLCDGPVQRVFARAGSVLHTREDQASLMLGFKSGATGLIETNWLTPHRVRTLTVVGSEAIAEVDYIGVTLDIYDGAWHRRANVVTQEPLRVELEHFVRCCRERATPLVCGEDGVHAVAVALAATVSAKTGTVQEME
ncbi:MAG TPA: Gfo/Idh/MocA family oxidoreductase [Dehalococcoidia bacterium]|nr:Gfo/Idh/MocA family oxidoreductase [Dehalococcoidia bacterium]